MRTYTKQELIDLCANACEGDKKARKNYKLLLSEAKRTGDKTEYKYLIKMVKQTNDCYKGECKMKKLSLIKILSIFTILISIISLFMIFMTSIANTWWYINFNCITTSFYMFEILIGMSMVLAIILGIILLKKKR